MSVAFPIDFVAPAGLRFAPLFSREEAVLMTTIADLADFLEALAPLSLAEEWDNVGLLMGDAAGQAHRVMTCLTITPAVVQEAIERRAELIVTHHPLPFRALKQLTTASTAGSLLWQLAGARIAIYSAHTAFDSATLGINQQLADGLELQQIQPLRLAIDDPARGSGRFGSVAEPTSLAEIAKRLKAFLQVEHLHAVGHLSHEIRNVAVACGSAGEFLSDAYRSECQLLITGETSFHTCLEAEARGVCLLLTGHYASERFAMEQMAQALAAQFADLEIWASQQESDPVQWI